MPPLKTGKPYWRSLDELTDKPEFRRFVENEFPAYADEMLAPGSRRTFLKIMGASLALAGMTGCRWPKEEILPFVRRPEGFTPGTPMQFATAMQLGGAAMGLLVTSYDGRPIKVEGNPSHPSSLGSTSAIQQASLLELYDPDRSQEIVRREGDREFVADWNEFTEFARQHFGSLRGKRGQGLRFLAEADSSPTVKALRERLLVDFPQAAWHEYEAVSRDNEREGTRLVYGSPKRPQPNLARAKTIVSFDDDFLLDHPFAVRNARDFTEGRRPSEHGISRLYVVESCYSTTGTMADRRIPVTPSEISAVAGCLGAKLVAEHGLRLPPGADGLQRMLERFREHPLHKKEDAIESMARDLMAQRGHSLLLAGPRQPAAIHALVHSLNLALGNVGRTLEYNDDPEYDRTTHRESIAELSREIGAGDVDTLVIVGGNPAYDAPADLDFASLAARVPTSLHLSAYRNETSELCGWHLPRAHYLESWGDARDWRGTLSMTQPLIEPLFGGKTTAELLSVIVGDTASSGHELVRETFLSGSDGEQAWREALHDGFVEGSAWPLTRPRPASASWARDLEPFLDARAAEGDGVDLAFVPDASVYDGRFANNGWLQEMPDPLTKLTWDNAALIGPSTAERFDLKQGDMVRLDHAGRTIEVPVYVMPGQAAGSLALSMGYGRQGGAVAEGVGFNAFTIRTGDAMHHAGVSLTKVGGSYPLSTTQNHYAIDSRGAQAVAERAPVLAREMEYHEYEEFLEHGHEHHPHVAPLFKPKEYDGYKWGMSIDLNACTGCNACTVACQAENNIPVVGKEEVSRGRDMHWIRVDRYFGGDVDDPSVSHQPLTCQHCEDAPCEQVCPVAATVHDSDGINVMVYNRCVGTRYCSNNCPYKVRRFNYFNNHKDESPLETMVYNPQVTVRSRGVMEKCSFCIQRINRVKIEAKNAKRPIADDEITTACAQACPTRAISFGDLNDPSSEVREHHEDPRAYALLESLSVKPRTRYLTRLRNRSSDGAHTAHTAHTKKG